jgi:phosphatidylethanolamine/phosphatidyl-N-methylethanolamine N-methyltransferase
MSEQKSSHNEPAGDPSKAAPDTSHALSAYARWAGMYDAVFTRILRRGRLALAEAANAIGGKCLNVGVGTGLELPMFGTSLRVTGIDLSEPMLEIARNRVTELGLTNVDDLLVMDAHNLAFPDASFDVVVAPYLVTILPDPQRSLDEMVRVVKPGGHIILANHIAAESGPVAWAESALAKIGPGLGWDPRFPWSVIGDWLERRNDVTLVERRTLPPLGLFALIHMQRR